MEAAQEQLAQLVLHLRHNPNINQETTFSISTSLLQDVMVFFNEFLEEESSMSTSFHIKPSNTNKTELMLDIQYLKNYMERTRSLKLFGLDNTCPPTNITDLSRFLKINSLEVQKVDVNLLKGLQQCRPQIQKLTCHRIPNKLDEVLNSCGADRSHSYYWNELKELRFTNGDISEIGGVFDWAPLLHTLDLSHNSISRFEGLSCLSNLKHLNLSYNKLEAVSNLSGQICSRLQNLILKNNFIDDIKNLQSLSSLCVLDLGNNCLIDHKALVHVSHLATLQWLNLENNPLSFHPCHRHKTSSYLHINTASTHFVLDYVALSKTEQKLVGSLHPMGFQMTGLRHSSSFATESLSNLSIDTRTLKRVRHVVIEDEEQLMRKSVEEEEEEETKSATPICGTILEKQYLETKKQIEDLHQQYGESWLNSHSGVLVQGALGLEASVVSSSPYDRDFSIYSDINTTFNKSPDVAVAKPVDQSDCSFLTALNETVNIANVEHQESDSSEASVDSEEDLDLEGEENMFLAAIEGDSSGESIFLVITKTHLSEKECSTSKEKSRWHIKSVNSCEYRGDVSSPEPLEKLVVKLEFETMRKDRQQRVYVFEDEEEMNRFVACVQVKISERGVDKSREIINYQCMKCSVTFSRRSNQFSLSHPGPSLICPKCESNLIIEQM